MKTFVLAFVCCVILVAGLAFSIAVGFYSLYVPYKFFTDQSWLVDNLAIVSFLPISWYGLWLAERYGLKAWAKICANVAISFVSIKYKLTEAEKQDLHTQVYAALAKQA